MTNSLTCFSTYIACLRNQKIKIANENFLTKAGQVSVPLIKDSTLDNVLNVRKP